MQKYTKKWLAKQLEKTFQKDDSFNSHLKQILPENVQNGSEYLPSIFGRNCCSE
jgi:hypothetical protein